MYKLAVFDMDGTLLDTLGDLQSAGNYALKQMGFPIHEREAYRLFIGKGLNNQISRSLPEARRDPETVEKATQIYLPYYAAHMMEKTHPYSGVPQLLLELKNRGIMLAVLSNKPDTYVRELAEYYFPGQFVFAMGKRDGIPLKPDATSLEIIRKGCGVSQDDCIFVGDSSVDIQTAHNGGMKIVAVSWGFSTKDELSAYHNVAIVDNTQQLLNIIVDNGPHCAI